MREAMRYIFGYIFGITIFLLLIPFGLCELSKLDYLLSGKVLINSMIFRYIFSILFFIAGVYFMIWSNVFLFKIGKGGPADGLGISISPQTKKLVTIGPYRYSRNPMVFGAFSLYVSIVIFLNSIIGLISILIFLFISINYLRLSEEKRLLKDFGDEFIDYKKNVSMIFPIKRYKR
jgi:protein-S-isoprenylcysteine O-methyltransferase Ste14